jgi:hypothetical protein
MKTETGVSRSATISNGDEIDIKTFLLNKKNPSPSLTKEMGFFFFILNKTYPSTHSFSERHAHTQKISL